MSFSYDQLGVSAYWHPLQEVNGSRIIFLLDESHDDDNATDQGVQVAIQLIRYAEVGLIGVEGYEGGRAYDDQTREYTDLMIPTSLDECRRIGDYTRFAEALVDFGEIEVIGVDCRGLSDRIEIDNIEGHVPRGGRHPLNIER